MSGYYRDAHRAAAGLPVEPGRKGVHMRKSFEAGDNGRAAGMGGGFLSPRELAARWRCSRSSADRKTFANVVDVLAPGVSF